MVQYFHKRQDLVNISTGQSKHDHGKDIQVLQQFKKSQYFVKMTLTAHVIIVLLQSFQAYLVKGRGLDSD